MNIFACYESPHQAALFLPDKHIVKMPLESAQMLAVAMGRYGANLGNLRKLDGSTYSHQAFMHHPCTQWACYSFHNMAWLIVHAQSLMFEYLHRYGKHHGCATAIGDASNLFTQSGYSLSSYIDHTPFARAMPAEFKYDDSIDTITAYRRYLQTKKWAAWKKDPARRPSWWIG